MRDVSSETLDVATKLNCYDLTDLLVGMILAGRLGVAIFGKVKLSCDVIVVNHISHQVIVFERMHIKK